MDDKKTGGPAFPVVGQGQWGGQPVMQIFDGGMTLRDYFAAQAISEILYVQEDVNLKAQRAYQLADAMLAEREKSK